MAKPLLWLDLEMTGLDETRDSILEVAAVVTDVELKTLGELHRIVFQPPSVLEGMNDWCKKTHGESGLTRACATGTPLEVVQKELVALLDQHFGPKADKIILCGNSIGNDRRFVDRHLPDVSRRLHYRLVDVSSFKEIFRERYGLHFKKPEGHRALDDIRQSIAELAFYLSHVQLPAGQGAGKSS
jgi:oligoribonuclease